VSVNSLVRQKGTEAGLTEGVWSLVQQYEGQLVGMTQYVLQETLPGLTHYVESRASDFLISHNLSKVGQGVGAGRSICRPHNTASATTRNPTKIQHQQEVRDSIIAFSCALQHLSCSKKEYD